MTHYHQYLQTDLGLVEIEASDTHIKAIGFVDAERESTEKNAITQRAFEQLEDYFAGNLNQFDLPLAPEGTEFQKSVWDCLLKIGFGDTASYADIAKMLNKPTAMRAVGAANGRNPIAIVIPCHRIIGANGTLTGYAGGLDRKARLLSLENPQSSFFEESLR